MLGGQFVEFPVTGQARQILDQHMVQERYPNLQGRGHGHAVHLHEYAVGHHKAHIQINFPVYLIHGIAAGRIPAQLPKGVALHCCAKGILKEPFF